VVEAVYSTIKSSRLQPHLDGGIEKLVGVVWFSKTSFGWGIFGSLWSFIGGYSFFFVSVKDVVFLNHSATSRPQPTMARRLREGRQRWHAVDTVSRLKAKDISRISL
jgi:hypothetical protein